MGMKMLVVFRMLALPAKSACRPQMGKEIRLARTPPV